MSLGEDDMDEVDGAVDMMTTYRATELLLASPKEAPLAEGDSVAILMELDGKYLMFGLRPEQADNFAKHLLEIAHKERV